MLKDFFVISLRNLRKRKLRSWLTLLGIFIGVAAVVSLVSLGEGMRAAISSQFENLGSDKIVIQAKGGGYGPPGAGVAEKLAEKDMDAIKSVSGVKAVAKRLIRNANLEFKEDIIYSYATSVPEDESRKLVVDTINPEMESGRFLKKEDKYSVVLGNNFAHDSIFEKEVRNGNKIMVRGQEFEVVGILDKKGSFMLDSTVLMNEAVMVDLFETGEDIDIIAVQVADETKMDKIVDDLEKTLRRARDVEEGKEDFTVQTPQDLLGTLNTIVSVVSLVLIGIASISLLVGGVGIMNTMYTSVLERTKEIGIMKSIGATNRNIFSLFLIESGMLGMTGGAIGVVLGFFLAKTVEYAGAGFLGEGVISVTFPVWLVAGSLAFSFVIGTVSGVLPAIHASRLKPVEALRFKG